MGTYDHGLSHRFRGPGHVVNGLIDKKCVDEVALHFQLELNKIRVLDVLTDKNLKH
jgi:hypothetical protein